MKNKKIITLLTFIISFMLFSSTAKASCSINVSTPSKVVVGQNFTVKVNIQSNPNLGNWEYVLSYDSSKVRLVSGGLKQADYSRTASGVPAVSYSYTFNALTPGTAKFIPTNYLISYMNESDCSPTISSANVTMKSQAEIEAGYSKNNNLSSLSVEGTELSPAFSASTLEYTATLPVDTTKAKIIATAQDSTASIVGAGEIDVVDGLNKVEITVTAQHGEKKTYVINLTVQELDPIKVKVNGKTYTIVRKSGQVENIPTGFAETKIKIKGQEVAAYKSELTKLVLVALKDDEGDIKLYIYDSKKNTYTSFMEAKGAGLNLLILNKVDKKVPLGFVSTKFKHNDITLNGYKLKDGKDDNYYLVYAQSLETGDKGFYLYDKKDGSFQRYYEELSDLKNTYIKYLFFALAGLIVLLALIILFKITKNMFSSKEKKIKKYEKKINKLKKKIEKEELDEEEYVEDDSYDIESVDEKPLIKKVEEDEYVVPKKSRKEKMKELEEAKRRLDKNKPSYRRVSLEDDEL